jgi:hypothetical protein
MADTVLYTTFQKYEQNTSACEQKNALPLPKQKRTAEYSMNKELSLNSSK